VLVLVGLLLLVVVVCYRYRMYCTTSTTTVDRVFIGTTSTLLHLIKAVDIK
jgi:hypothetical protein